MLIMLKIKNKFEENLIFKLKPYIKVSLKLERPQRVFKIILILQSRVIEKFKKV